MQEERRSPGCSFIPQTEGGLKRGFTTGSCAAAASKAAAQLLFENGCAEKASLLTPKGIQLELVVESREKKDGWARCSVKKFAGDDPDVTNGICIYSTVSLCAEKISMASDCDGYIKEVGGGLTLYLRGGEGIGRVTRAGLSCPVGMWAINPVPRSMIFAEVAQVCQKAGFKGTVWITVEIPGGRELAQKTFNPRLGIEGGLSVLGSSGIVEPMSEPALLETIRLEIHQRAMENEACLLMIPGNYGERFLAEALLLPVEKAIRCSNYIGNALDMALAAGIKRILLVGHAGKLIKLAAGVMNTHSRTADGRMECLAAYGAACGASQEMVRQILDCVTVDEALTILEQEEGCREETMKLAMRRISVVLKQRTGGCVQTEAVLFTDERGILGMTEGAIALVEMVSAGFCGK